MTTFGLAIVSLFCIVLLLLFWPFLFAALWDRFHAIQSHIWARVLMTVFLVFVAYSFYRIREHFRRLYGAAEIIIGIVGCWAVLRNIQAERMTIALALAGLV